MMWPVLLALLGADATPGWTVSLETDPVFWVGTLPNGPGLDGNLDVTVRALPGWRLGVLGWAGTWSGALAHTVVLPSDFVAPDWAVRWNGAGIEGQYQWRLGLARGGLGVGLRVQWNQFQYLRSGALEAQADHLVVTPQVGFQWFPFEQLGLYLLPWAGVQLPIAGTTTVSTSEGPHQSRRVLPVVTAHLGWAF
jgi:dihydroflavonol-4-reductase